MALISALMAGGALAAPLDDAMSAVGAGDCQRVGAIVNRGIEDRTPSLLYFAGLMYDEGLCVDRDAERAARYYQAGAQIGDWRAARDLGLRYALGDGLPRSYTRASAWLQHAEQLGRQEPTRTAQPHLALPPAGEDTATEWLGYLWSLHFLAGRLARYPRDALVMGAEGEFDAHVCPAQDRVEVAVRRQRGPGVWTGTDHVRSRHELIREVERAYLEAMRVLPRPAAVPADHQCLQNVFVFRIQ